jgi:hypothetical protein
MPRKISKAAQAKTQQARAALIAKSKLAKQWQEKAAADASEAGEEEKAIAIAMMGVNEILRGMIAKEAGRDDFKTAAEWKKDGFRIAKGEKAYRVWGSPVQAKSTVDQETHQQATEQENSDSDDLDRKYKLWPMCCLFHGGQVVPLDKEPAPKDETDTHTSTEKAEQPKEQDDNTAAQPSAASVDLTGSPFVRDDYQDRIDAKRERFSELASQNAAKSTNEVTRAIDMVHGLPAGQPILVGHHSERSHRALLSRSDNAMKRGIEADKKADYYQERAASVGTAGISSDDPDALPKLIEQRDKRVSLQNHMKAVNKALRSNDSDSALKALGLTDKQIEQINTPNTFGDKGYARFELTNNNANIRRLNKRIEELQALYSTDLPTLENDEVAIEWEQGRAMINFKGGKPSDEARTLAKKAGFRWSRYQSRWTRKLNQRTIFEAKRVFNELNSLPAIY